MSAVGFQGNHREVSVVTGVLQMRCLRDGLYLPFHLPDCLGQCTSVTSGTTCSLFTSLPRPRTFRDGSSERDRGGVGSAGSNQALDPNTITLLKPLMLPRVGYSPLVALILW